ncbi:MAG: substrate-binding domain-containing protein [Lachnospiraceae bacterium]|nr:substrate-binding domain-containing protein [Lachnospiraceae bacterium]
MDKRKTTIAVMMRDVGTDFTEVMYSGMYDAAREEDINIVYLLGPQSAGEDRVFEDDDIDDEYVDQLDSVYDYVGILKPDALVIVSGSVKRSRVLPDINALVERYKSVPMLVLETTPVKPSIAYQVAESYQAMCECVEHLIVDHRCKFIVYVSGNPDEYDFRERLRAFKDTMNAHSLNYDDEQIVIIRSESMTERRIGTIFDDFPYVDAVVCSCDQYARIVYRICNRRGIKIGKEVAVTGFDDVGRSHVMTPELTGVMYDSYAFGYEAIKRAIRVAGGERIGGVKIPCRFIKRESCGCVMENAAHKHEGPPVPVDDTVKDRIEDYLNKTLDKAVDDIYTVLPYENEKRTFKGYYGEMFYYLYEAMFTEWEDIDEVLVNMKRYIFILAGYKEISFRMVSDKTTEIMENMMSMTPYGRQRAKLTAIIMECTKYIKEAEIVKMRERGAIRREHLWFIPLFTKDLLNERRSEVDVLTSIMKRLRGMNVKSAHFFLHNKTVVYRRDQLPPLPQKLNYAGYFNREEVRIFLRQNGVGIDYENGISSVLPEDSFNGFVSFVICSGNRQYGMILYEIDREDIFFAMMCTLQIGALFHFRDIRYAAEASAREAKVREDILGYVSFKDDLTGILNGRGFVEKFIDLAYTNSGAKGWFFFADVAHIHEINLTYGHKYGDETIKCLADRMRMILGEENYLARIGEDEFISVILSDNCDIIDSIKASVTRVLKDYNLTSDVPFEVEALMEAYPFVCSENMNVSALLSEAEQAIRDGLKSTGHLKIKKK